MICTKNDESYKAGPDSQPLPVLQVRVALHAAKYAKQASLDPIINRDTSTLTCMETSVKE